MTREELPTGIDRPVASRRALAAIGGASVVAAWLVPLSRPASTC